MAKRQPPKKDHHPPNKPRMVHNFDGKGIGVVRIPEGTDWQTRQKLINETRKLSYNQSGW